MDWNPTGTHPDRPLLSRNRHCRRAARWVSQPCQASSRSFCESGLYSRLWAPSVQRQLHPWVLEPSYLASPSSSVPCHHPTGTPLCTQVLGSNSFCNLQFLTHGDGLFLRSIAASPPLSLQPPVLGTSYRCSSLYLQPQQIRTTVLRADGEAMCRVHGCTSF